MVESHVPPYPHREQHVGAEEIRTATNFDELKTALDRSFGSNEWRHASTSTSQAIGEKALASPQQEASTAPQSPIAEIGNALSDCEALVASGERNAQTRQQLNEAMGALMNTLAEETYEAAEIAPVVDTLGKLSAHLPEGQWWEIADVMTSSQKSELLADPHSGLHTILQKGAESQKVRTSEESYGHFVRTLDTAVGAYLRAPAIFWRRKGEAITKLPSYAQEIANDPRFVPTCIDMSLEKLEGIASLRRRGNFLRETEGILSRDLLGLSDELTEDFRLAFDTRSLKKDHKGVIPLEDGGGIEEDYWADTLKRYATTIEAIGPSNAERLRQEFGLANFDRYAPEDLKSMLGILDKDPATLAKAQAEDVVVQMIGPISHNRAFDESARKIKEAADPQSLIVYYEPRRPSDFEDNLARLKEKYGVEASHLLIELHGKAEVGMGLHAPTPEGEQGYNISRSSMQQFGAFLEGVMRPSRHTGERQVVLLSCEQAAPPPRKAFARLRSVLRREPKGVEDLSTVAALASGTQPGSSVVVKGPRKSTWLFNERDRSASFVNDNLGIEPTVVARNTARGVRQHKEKSFRISA